MDVLYLLVGIAGLFIGGELLVHGAAHLARSFGISTLLVGLTVVAVGTSTPELLTNLTAAAKGAPELALGNVVGSNVANIGLVLGATGLVSALAVKDPSVRWHIWFMSAVTLVLAILLWDGRLARTEGAALVTVYVLYTLHAYRVERSGPHRPATSSTPHEDAFRAAVAAHGATGGGDLHDAVDADAHDEATQAIDDLEMVDPAEGGTLDPAHISRPREIIRLLVGLVLLAAGAAATVEGAIGLATSIGISEFVIGITIVALGTSLPELVASLLSARRGHAELGIGNAVGSNIANLLLVLGLTALVLPITTEPGSLRTEFVVMLAFALVLLPMARDRVFSRRESAVLLAGYLAFTVVAVLDVGL